MNISYLELKRYFKKINFKCIVLIDYKNRVKTKTIKRLYLGFK